MNDAVSEPSWRAWARVAELPRSGQVAGRGVIRGQAEDFIVEEVPVQEPEGAGEHLWLWVEKRVENTEAVAKRLARAAGVKPMAVGYAGRKDRHALTRQWFSVHLPGGVGGEAPPSGFETEHVRVLRSSRHSRKLRVGGLRGNRFVLRMRELEIDAPLLEQRLRSVVERGVPNYFGEQRFGRGAANLEAAVRMFSGHPERDRKRRGLYLSAARSAVFNGILARRVADNCWDKLLPGEAVMLDGSNSFFVADAVDTELEQRLAAHDIHPSGALWGEGEPPCRNAAAQVEADVLGEADVLARGLVAAGLRQERRPLRLCPKNLHWSLDEADHSLMLEFMLPAGAFATAVLRDLLEYRDASSR
ncbi:MAG: tRNA pseudouridine(13) synthase TruD [Acidihalobacter sp.]|uniref:tRNA pseudouridine(13) synthase TruD n=1 Tax=Acidihalobacter sp. TaxID=1872108 RepID=UPI00307CE71B